MLTHNHVQLAMAVIKTHNDGLKQAGKDFLSPDELREIEKAIIKWVNRWNKIENFFVNNRIVLWIKEAFYEYLIGYPYPLVLYCDRMDAYIKSLGFGTDVEILCSNPDDAFDFSKMNYFQRKKILKNVEYGFFEKLRFRYRKILTYGKGLQQVKNDNSN